MSQKQDLLLEFFGEEIPARMQLKAAADFKTLFEKSFIDLAVGFESVETYITPRRVCVSVKGLDVSQPDISEERKGPKIDAPEQAIQGFLKSTGLSLEQCEKRELDKGTFYFAKIESKGRPTEDLIPECINGVITAFTWSKSMRWMGSDKMWVRPLHTGICVFGDKTLSFEVEFGGGWKMVFGNITHGHRFMANQPIEVTRFEDYKQKLKQHFVILDHRERRAFILSKANELAGSKGLKLVQDDRLLDEVTGLVEWPVLLMGQIEERFMKLPPELLITVMKSHQKYFALEDESGKLSPYFLVTSNIEASDGGAAVVEGNGRVLRARFSDAEFFYDLDRKKPFETFVQKLDKLIFHVDLGSMGEKTKRLEALSGYVAQEMGTDVTKAQRAARLCKADLTTEMVQEFPELQGIMGRYYAAPEGAEVAQVIEDHYGPRGEAQVGALSPISRAVALADKIDTLTGFFGIGIKPTGSKDPYALRRAAIGIIRLVEANFDTKLSDVLQKAIEIYGATLKTSPFDLIQELNAFMIDRLTVYWKDQGIRYDTLNAVLPMASDDPISVLKKRALALEAFIQGDDGEDLLAAYKRASNIVRIEQEKDRKVYANPVNADLLEQDQERDLIQALEKSEAPIQESMQVLNFEGAMRELSHLRPFVDAFFEQVTVNDNNPQVRENRLNLLSKIRVTLEKVADFSKIERG